MPGGKRPAHAGSVYGVLALEDRLVSWGTDGATHFWSPEGARLRSGSTSAHAGSIYGVLALEDRLVSWG